MHFMLHAFLFHALPLAMSYYCDAMNAFIPPHTANSPHHVQQTPPSITSTPVKPLHPTQVANTTTIRHTTPTQTQSNHTSKPTEPAQNGSTTVTPTQRTTVEQTPAGPNFGDVSQPDDSSGTEIQKIQLWRINLAKVKRNCLFNICLFGNFLALIVTRNSFHPNNSNMRVTIISELAKINSSSL